MVRGVERCASTLPLVFGMFVWRGEAFSSQEESRVMGTPFGAEACRPSNKRYDFSKACIDEHVAKLCQLQHLCWLRKRN